MKKFFFFCQKIFSYVGVLAVALLLINAVASPAESEQPHLSEDDPLLVDALRERDSLPIYPIGSFWSMFIGSPMAYCLSSVLISSSPL